MFARSVRIPARPWAAALLALALASAGIVTISASASGDDPAEAHGSIAVPSGAKASACPTGVSTSSPTAWLLANVHPGRTFELTADSDPWHNDFDVSFFSSLAECQAGIRLPYRNHAGDERSVVPEHAALGLVHLNTGVAGSAFTFRELPNDPVSPRLPGHRRPTVVAVLEVNADYIPYFNDFLGSKHPWNTDGTDANDINFSDDPETFVPGYPAGSEPLQLRLPQGAKDDISALVADDKTDGVWKRIEQSTASETHLYRFPGTKVIGAVRFGNEFGPPKDLGSSHATKSASVAVGNIHGTCPECLVVFVGIGAPEQEDAAVRWVARQPWIDVVTNSYATNRYTLDSVLFPPLWKPVHDFNPTLLELPQDGIDPEGPTDATLAATRNGQTWLYASGNGIEGSGMVPVPPPSYYSSTKGPDWLVTVGGIDPDSDQPYFGNGQPVDIAAYFERYTAASGNKADSETVYSGTSNATPVVAGTLARVIQRGRDILGDQVPVHDPGVVAAGRPIPCPAANRPCPLADGILTRTEAEAVLFQNATQSANRTVASSNWLTPVVTTPMSATASSPSPTGLSADVDVLPTGVSVATYATEGHGIVFGRGVDSSRYVAEQRRLSDTLLGLVPPIARQPGERAWMIADSRCRQLQWGSWDGGYYKPGDPAPAFDPVTDQPAIALWAACSAPLPDHVWSQVPFPDVGDTLRGNPS